MGVVNRYAFHIVERPAAPPDNRPTRIKRFFRMLLHHASHPIRIGLLPLFVPDPASIPCSFELVHVGRFGSERDRTVFPYEKQLLDGIR